ncbi:MAG: hypothetical protein WAN51_03540 [Alphaproteobacteria bacterium]
MIDMYWAASAIFFAYIICYLRTGPLHPVGFLCINMFVWFALKFLYYHYNGFSHSLVSSEDAFYFSGEYLLLFMCTIAVTHGLWSVFTPNLPVVEVKPRFSFLYLNFAAIAVLPLIGVAAGGADVLFHPAALRVAIEHGGLYYFSQLYLFSGIAGAVECAKSRRRKKTLYFFAINLFLALLLARASYIFTLYIAYLTYDAVVNRKPHYLQLLGGGAVLALLAVFLLIYRNAAESNSDLSQVAVRAWDVMFSGGLDRVLYLVISREEQWETFTRLVEELRLGHLAHDPWFPIYALVQFVPRGLWPDKPPLFTTLMTGYFSPKVLASGAANNYTGLGELLYSYGPPGIVIAGVISGFFFHYVSYLCRVARTRSDVFFWLFLVVANYMGLSIFTGYFNDYAIPSTLLNLVLLAVTCRLSVFRPPLPAGSSQPHGAPAPESSVP